MLGADSFNVKVEGSTTTLGPTAVSLHFTDKEKCHRGQALFCNLHIYSNSKLQLGGMTCIHTATESSLTFQSASH